MKKNGFAFIETIITIVILASYLLYLYNSYSVILSEEEIRLTYDDAAYIYYTNYIRKFLDEYADLNTIKTTSFTNSYIVTIGSDNETLFAQDLSKKQLLESIIDSYKINQMVLIKTEMFDECFSSDKTKCKSSLENLSYSMRMYVNTLNDTSSDYLLVVEYANKTIESDEFNFQKCTPGQDENCKSYFASLGI